MLKRLLSMFERLDGFNPASRGQSGNGERWS